MVTFSIFVSSQLLYICVCWVSPHFDWSFLLDDILLQYYPRGFSGLFLDGWHLSWSAVCKTQLCISQDCVLSFTVEMFFFSLYLYRKFLSNNNHLPLSLSNCNYFSSDDLANFLCPVLGRTDCLLFRVPVQITEFFVAVMNLPSLAGLSGLYVVLGINQVKTSWEGSWC